MVKSSADRPPLARRVAWLPVSTTRPSYTTTIRSAMRTVENRSHTSSVTRYEELTRRGLHGTILQDCAGLHAAPRLPADHWRVCVAAVSASEDAQARSEEDTSEIPSLRHLVC